MQELSGLTLNTPESIESDFAKGNVGVRRNFVPKVDAGKIQDYFLTKPGYHVHLNPTGNRSGDLYHIEVVKLGERKNA